MARHYKTCLPDYDVFDEYRYFEPGPNTAGNFKVFMVGSEPCALLICEEVWNDLNSPETNPRPFYHEDPVKLATNVGAKTIFAINASPYRMGVEAVRRKMLRKHCTDNMIRMVYVNQVGGNDEVVFDGNSFAMDDNGHLCMQAPCAKSGTYTAIFGNEGPVIEEPVDDLCGTLNKLRPLALRDYCEKQGMTKLLVSVSGGIDSALALWDAVQAVGAENVLAFSQPSEFSSEGSKTDAFKLCETLDVKIDTIPIAQLHHNFRDAINKSINRMCHEYGEKEMAKFLGIDPKKPIDFRGVADENLQPRIRGIMIMAWANMVNGLVVSTGNKSEMAVGYCTLYGDMCGGFNVLKDCPKIQVIDCCKDINKKAGKEIIPWGTIEKPPSAELKPNQKDTDSLPPYSVLDEIVRRYCDESEDVGTILAEMCKEYKTTQSVPKEIELKAMILKTCAMIDRAEYKRRQGPLGVKLTKSDLSRGRQVPVVQGWTNLWNKQIGEKSSCY